MADTDIEWATKVWNFVRGCRRVSPGCGGPHNEGGCYAERLAIRFSGTGGTYEGLVQSTPKGPRWTGAGRFVPEKLAEPLSWKRPRDGSRHRIFVNSMSDLFFEEFSNEQIAAGFGVMAACPEHDFLILTKRAERMREWFGWIGDAGWAERRCNSEAAKLNVRGLRTPLDCTWPLPNVWLGVSAEDQQRANERIPHLLATPAAVRFVSAEPLIGPIDFDRWLAPVDGQCKAHNGYNCGICRPRGDGQGLHWVIVGGESGPGARPCDVEWIEDIVRQCREAGVAVFCKQLGSVWAREHGFDRLSVPGASKGGAWEVWPAPVRAREFPHG